ncbi:MAG TPA: hypothetical protein VF126_15990 [Acidobacteriaceae bacterium]
MSAHYSARDTPLTSGEKFCPACAVPFTDGAKVCPACALPLTAIARPTAAAARRPTHLWPYFVLAFSILWIVTYGSDHVIQTYHQHALTIFRAALQPDGALATPAAFQAACGRATETAAREQETRLTYANAAHLTVHFVPGKAVSFTRQQVFRDNDGSWRDIDGYVSDDGALRALDCNARLEESRAQ